MATIIITKNKKIRVRQRDIARELNLHPVTVNEWFTHKRPLPKKYIPIMKKYGVPLFVFRMAA